MPIYEYKCEQGHTFEIMQRITDDPLVSCQTCQAPVQRVFHPVAVHFKGSGFYNTDYGTRKRAREDGSKDGGKEDSGSKAEDKKAEDKKPEAKPASKSASSESAASS